MAKMNNNVLKIRRFINILFGIEYIFIRVMSVHIIKP